jgi:hypothetical protein
VRAFLTQTNKIKSNMEQQPLQPTTPPSAPPKNWLVESILVTILCCLPFGIAGIVFATQVNTKWSAGDYTGAAQSSKEAAKWTKIGFFVGIGWIVICMLIWGAAILAMLGIGAAAANSQ